MGGIRWKLYLQFYYLSLPFHWSHGTSASMGLGASNTVFGISKDGGPLARATEVVATLFIVSALLLYLVK